MTAFERIIQRIKITANVLDVGAWGLGGGNTSQYISQRFRNTTYMNIKPFDKVTLVGDFYTYKFKEKFDLIVLDLDIEKNVLKDWSPEGLKRVRGLLKEGGMLLNYIMTTDQYGRTEETPKLIRRRWKEYWNSDGPTLQGEAIGRKLKEIPGYDLFMHFQEEERPEIIWVMLKKND